MYNNVCTNCTIDTYEFQKRKTKYGVLAINYAYIRSLFAFVTQ